MQTCRGSEESGECDETEEKKDGKAVGEHGMAPRAARLRRTQSAGSTSSSSTATTSSSEPGDSHDPPVKPHHGHGRSNPGQSLIHIIVTSRVLKYALAAGGLTILLLIFAATWKQEAPGGCHMCMHGDGLVHEGPLFDDLENVDEELEDDDGFPFRSTRTNRGHRQVCPRLYHERQQSRLDLLHSFNNLLQVRGSFVVSLDRSLCSLALP